MAIYQYHSIDNAWAFIRMKPNGAIHRYDEYSTLTPQDEPFPAFDAHCIIELRHRVFDRLNKDEVKDKATSAIFGAHGSLAMVSPRVFLNGSSIPTEYQLQFAKWRKTVKKLNAQNEEKTKGENTMKKATVKRTTKKATVKQPKVVEELAPAKKATAKRAPAKKAQKVEKLPPIQKMWADLFAENEKCAKAKRLTDEQILEAALKIRPDKADTPYFQVGAIQIHRRNYNKGNHTKGEVPAKQSHRYDENGDIIDPSRKAPTKKSTKKAPAKNADTKKVVKKTADKKKTKAPAKEAPARKVVRKVIKRK